MRGRGLTALEREEISRGVAAGESGRVIARSLGRVGGCAHPAPGLHVCCRERRQNDVDINVRRAGEGDPA